MASQARKHLAGRPSKRSTYEFLVSGCLSGIHCNYKGHHKLNRRIRKMVAGGIALPVCPEVLGGAPVPRPPCELGGGTGAAILAGTARACTASGSDVTKILIEGARRTLQLAVKYGIKKAILKSKSPSCGKGEIYDGTFSRSLRRGDGVTTALLKRHRIKIYTEKDADAKQGLL